MTRTHFSLLLLCLCSCRQSPGWAAARDALSTDADASVATLSVDELAQRALTSLHGAEARAVCEAASERCDPCLQHAFYVSNTSQSQCERQLARCRSVATPPSYDCSVAHFDLGSDCSATVSDYLTCLKDLPEALACSDHTGLLEIHASCLPLVRSCPTLALEFGDLSTYSEPCDAASAPERKDDDADIRGLDACRPVPTRMVVLGDSIAACSLAQNACGPDLIAEDLRKRYAPGLDYQRLAVAGSQTKDWMLQAEKVKPGPGHLLIWIWVGGNDLHECTVTVQATQVLGCIADVLSRAEMEWQKLFSYFTDASRFPDGATFMLNTQYTLNDACMTATTPFGAPAFEATLRHWNDVLFVQPAIARGDTVAIDHYPDWLGHARNANKRICNHCSRDDNSRWLVDGTHPNDKGHQHIADKWKVAVDEIYGGCDGRSLPAAE